MNKSKKYIIKRYIAKSKYSLNQRVIYVVETEEALDLDEEIEIEYNDIVKKGKINFLQYSTISTNSNIIIIDVGIK